MKIYHKFFLIKINSEEHGERFIPGKSANKVSKRFLTFV